MKRLSVLMACALAGQVLGQEKVGVRIRVDTEGASTRLVLTASRDVSAAVTQGRGNLEIVYSEPVDVRPPDGRTDDPILTGWSMKGDRTVVATTGPGFKSYEAFNLRNPTRLVLDLEGTGSGHANLPERVEMRPGFVVVVDPGHGGVETGAVGASGLQEKDLALDLARRLKSVLQQDPGVGVVLTRDEDRVVPLDERTAIANHNRADLFLSIHLNSSKRKQAVGAETYFLSPEATDDEARTTAALENRAYDSATASAAVTVSRAEGLDLVLWDLAQNQYLAQSGRLAESIQAELNQLAGTRNRGVRQAPFRVLMGATMPAVLVEVGFISNPEEESKLQADEHRNRIVEAISRAIAQFRLAIVRFEIPGASGEAGQGSR